MFPGFTLEVFGSERTRLFLPESDVDMVILPPNNQELPNHKIRNNLFQIADVSTVPAETVYSLSASSSHPHALLMVSGFYPLTDI